MPHFLVVHEDMPILVVKPPFVMNPPHGAHGLAHYCSPCGWSLLLVLMVGPAVVAHKDMPILDHLKHFQWSSSSSYSAAICQFYLSKPVSPPSVSFLLNPPPLPLPGYSYVTLVSTKPPLISLVASDHPSYSSD